ncbi:hypothetical protein KY347_03370 [Candidatus Woesearchaeota archaeon]|nr:hypothetical protein [Candidatus Woesearchaeota archaeon]
MKTGISLGLIFAVAFLVLINSAAADPQIIDIDNLKSIAVPIHVMELFLALFISYMSLKFFRITKPISLFLYLYMAIGFIIINSLLYLVFYWSINTRLNISFVNVCIGGRIALIGALISLAIFFYRWNKVMREKLGKAG